MSILNQYTKPILSFLAVYVPQVLEHCLKSHCVLGYNFKHSVLLQHSIKVSDVVQYQENYYISNVMLLHCQIQPAKIIASYLIGTHLAGDDASLIKTVATNVSSIALLESILSDKKCIDVDKILRFTAFKAIPTVLLTLIHHDYDKHSEVADDIQPQDTLETPEWNLDQVDVQPQDIIFN